MSVSVAKQQDKCWETLLLETAKVGFNSGELVIVETHQLIVPVSLVPFADH